MKKTIALVYVFVYFALGTFGQTFNVNNLLPLNKMYKKTHFKYTNDSFLAHFYDTTTNKNWNFTNLDTIDAIGGVRIDRDTIFIYSSENHSDTLFFPDANIVISQTNNWGSRNKNYFFYKKNMDTIKYLGNADDNIHTKSISTSFLVKLCKLNIKDSLHHLYKVKTINYLTNNKMDSLMGWRSIYFQSYGNITVPSGKNIIMFV